MPLSAEDRIREYSHSKDLVALRITSGELGGLFSKKLVVPYNSAALVRHEDGETSLSSAGRTIGGRFEALLAKTGEIHLDMEFDGLRSADGWRVRGRASVAVQIDTRTIESFLDFERFSGGTFRKADLKAYLKDRVRAGLSELASSRQARELHRKDLLGEIERAVGGRLRPHLVGTGVLFDRVLSGGFASEEYEQQIARARSRDREQQERQRRLKEIATFLNREESIQKLLAEIDDPRLKLHVYRELIQTNPEQGEEDLVNLDEAAVRKVHGVMQRLLLGSGASLQEIMMERATGACVALGSKVVEIPLDRPGEWKGHEIGEGIRSVRAARIGERDLLLIGGKRTCILFDPENGERRLFPLPEIKQPRGGINSVDAFGDRLYATHSEFGLAMWDLQNPGRPGELIHRDLTRGQRTTRGVRVIQDKLLFATGASVYFLDLTSPESRPERYPTSHGAVTSTTLAGRTLFAATEEGVILSWELGKPDYPEVVLRTRSPVTAIRVVKGHRGITHLFYCFNDTSVRARVIGQTLETAYEALGSTFTTFDATSDGVLACGHRTRRVYLWQPGNPRRPERTLDLSAASPHEIMDVCFRKRLVVR